MSDFEYLAVELYCPQCSRNGTAILIIIDHRLSSAGKKMGSWVDDLGVRSQGWRAADSFGI